MISILKTRVQNLKLSALFCIAVSLLFLAGCMQIRLLTYPSEFIWLDEKDVNGTMHVMATRMKNLQSMVENNSLTLDASQRKSNHLDILNELTMLEELAISVSPKTSGVFLADDQEISATNHLLLDEHIDDFIGEVMRARTFAENSPPNYYGIGQLVGNCNACHRQR